MPQCWRPVADGVVIAERPARRRRRLGRRRLGRRRRLRRRRLSQRRRVGRRRRWRVGRSLGGRCRARRRECGGAGWRGRAHSRSCLRRSRPRCARPPGWRGCRQRRRRREAAWMEELVHQRRVHTVAATAEEGGRERAGQIGVARAGARHEHAAMYSDPATSRSDVQRPWRRQRRDATRLRFTACTLTAVKCPAAGRGRGASRVQKIKFTYTS